MTPTLILSCIALFFAVLITIAWLTSRRAGDAAYYLGNKESPWYILAFGLIGETLSGVTFISVPGQVGKIQFAYLQMVLGYALGYLVIAGVLLPLYYRLNLTSIYSYLRGRYGVSAQRTGSAFFLLSRLVGASARLYLSAGVIQMFVFDAWGVPFAVTVGFIILLMLAYTYKGGIKTIVWTDTFLSGSLLLGLVLSVVFIARNLQWGPVEVLQNLWSGEHSKIFFWDWASREFFPKQFIGGAVVAICMTGLDQNMMQKNLSCRTLEEAQRNIRWFALVVVIVNIFFLSLGGLLYQYAAANQIPMPANSDHLFPLLAFKYLGWAAGLVFIIGLTSATFASADAVLTTLTTSFCIDMLDLKERKDLTEAEKTRVRHQTHILFAILLLTVILIFKATGNDAVINLILKLANYTYGPLLGLFAFGLFVRKQVKDELVPVVCLVPPLICWLLETHSQQWFGGYIFSNELLLINGLLTFAGLWLIRK